MLNKRTNILFDEVTWQMLQEVSTAKNTSVGQLVRLAVKDVYFSQNKSNKRQKLLADIDQLNKKIVTKDINYQDLIKHGRRF